MEGDGGESKPPSSHVHHQQQQHVVVLEGGDVVDVDDNSEGRSDGDDKDDDDGKAATLSDAASGTLSRLSKMPLAGHAAILLACVLQTVTAVIIKILTEVDPFLLMSWRAVLIILLAGPLAAWTYNRKKKRKKKKEKKRSREKERRLSRWKTRLLLLFRGSIMGVSVCLAFYVIRNMPLGDVRMIAASAPVFVAVLARIFLREPCGVFQIATMTLTMLGVLIVIQPPFLLEPLGLHLAKEVAERQKTHFVFGAMAVAAAVCQALGTIATKALKDANAFLISFTSSCMGFWIGLAASGIFGSFQLPSLRDAGLMTLAGFVSFLGQILMIMGLKLDDVTSMALARKSEDILLGFAAQVLYFGDIPGVVSLVGATLILTCILLSGFRKIVQSKEEEAPKGLRNFFCLDPNPDKGSLKEEKKEEGEEDGVEKPLNA